MQHCDETKPFIFISYSHKDTETVEMIIGLLRESGFNVWYDAGIEPGTEWDENIAQHVIACSYFIAFLSENYLKSSNCKDELNYSRDLEKNQLLVYLEDAQLPSGMAMRLNRIQSIFWHHFENEKEAFGKLCLAKGIEVARVSGAKSEETDTEEEEEERKRQEEIYEAAKALFEKEEAEELARKRQEEEERRAAEEKAKQDAINEMAAKMRAQKEAEKIKQDASQVGKKVYYGTATTKKCFICGEELNVRVKICNRCGMDQPM